MCIHYSTFQTLALFIAQSSRFQLYSFKTSSISFLKILFKSDKMVAFTAFVSAISMALLASTASAAPSVVAARGGPPTSSVIDFTLYKTITPGQENMCYTQVDVVHVAPTDLVANGGSSTVCNTGDFYVAQIDTLAWGWNCQRNSSPSFSRKYLLT
jgi:hypothetical protein